MLEKLLYLTGRVDSRKIMVIGSGRSGTHWLAQILESHPRVRATIEGTKAFHRVTRMALDPSTRPLLLPKVLRYYRWQHLRSHPRHYLDKSHPNLWLAPELAHAFPDALFLGIERNPYGTVASMLKHRGVLAWHRRWREFPIPNAFLGITEELAERYDSMDLAEQCALRWKAHHDRMAEMGGLLGDRLLRIQYEDLFENTDEALARLADFVGLGTPIPRPEIRRESLFKWKEQLTDEQIGQVEAVTGVVAA